MLEKMGYAVVSRPKDSKSSTPDYVTEIYTGAYINPLYYMFFGKTRAVSLKKALKYAIEQEVNNEK